MLYQDFDDACTRSILTILHVLKEEKEVLSLYLGVPICGLSDHML